MVEINLITLYIITSKNTLKATLSTQFDDVDFAQEDANNIMSLLDDVKGLTNHSTLSF